MNLMNDQSSNQKLTLIQDRATTRLDSRFQDSHLFNHKNIQMINNTKYM